MITLGGLPARRRGSPRAPAGQEAKHCLARHCKLGSARRKPSVPPTCRAGGRASMPQYSRRSARRPCRCASSAGTSMGCTQGGGGGGRGLIFPAMCYRLLSTAVLCGGGGAPCRRLQHTRRSSTRAVYPPLQDGGLPGTRLKAGLHCCRGQVGSVASASLHPQMHPCQPCPAALPSAPVHVNLACMWIRGPSPGSSSSSCGTLCSTLRHVSEVRPTPRWRHSCAGTGAGRCSDSRCRAARLPRQPPSPAAAGHRHAWHINTVSPRKREVFVAILMAPQNRNRQASQTCLQQPAPTRRCNTGSPVALGKQHCTPWHVLPKSGTRCSHPAVGVQSTH